MKIMQTVMALILLAIIVTPIVMHFFPAINYREMPEGLIEGKLSEYKPNWVSSLVAADNNHYIFPLKIDNLQLVATCLKKFPKTTVVKVDETRLIAYRQSKIFNFVDWISIDHHGQVTSSATLGYYDFGKNRQWVESIRSECTKPVMASDSSTLFG